MNIHCTSTLSMLCLIAACQGSSAPLVDPSEAMPGGTTTNTLLLGRNAFGQHAKGLSTADEEDFYTGNSFFNDSWVQAPASTTARDGLGPTFNARSCSGCHFKDGRGYPEGAEGHLGLLLRLSVPGAGEHGEPMADATFGGQLQDQALPGVPQEGTIGIAYKEKKGKYNDGESYSLRQPNYTIENPFAPLPEDLLISPRVAPAMIGMGLLEAIPEKRLRQLADPDDQDGDGISGKINRVWNMERQSMDVGRFGWKAEQPTVLQQTAGAFLGDMGITSRLFPQQNCPGAQGDCMAATSGGDPEVSDDILNKVALYARSLAVPVRRHMDDAQTLHGRELFSELGCSDCHTPSHTTGTSPIAALENQTIWPYTDLLLHDMGDKLSDKRPSFDAQGSEWRTSPLWGVGLINDVNGHQYLLHDGRARGVAEAILWHGGEGQEASDAFAALPRSERDAVVSFVDSL